MPRSDEYVRDVQGQSPYGDALLALEPVPRALGSCIGGREKTSLTIVEVKNGTSAGIDDEVYRHQGIRLNRYYETVPQAGLQTPSGKVAEAIAMRLKIACS